MSSIEIYSLVLVFTSIAMVVDEHIQIKKYRKTKNEKAYRRIKVTIYSTVTVAPIIIYSMTIATEDIFRLALIFAWICGVVTFMKSAPIVLKEEMKKL